MQTNVSPLLSQVTQPSLMVTSDDDRTAHPAGSRFVAERLPNARLQVERHGDHLSLFDARSYVTKAASRFLETVGYQIRTQEDWDSKEKPQMKADLADQHR